jgi:hypothetical protein
VVLRVAQPAPSPAAPIAPVAGPVALPIDGPDDAAARPSHGDESARSRKPARPARATGDAALLGVDRSD